MKTYIFDIDGTLANLSHRLHHIQKRPKDWDSFFNQVLADTPHQHIVNLANTLMLAGETVIYVSGRPERTRMATEKWLQLHLHRMPPYAKYGRIPLYMRADGDRRDDDIVKAELLAKIRAEGFDPVMAFDDRDRVVKMWRANGVPAAQVADGNF